MASAKVQSTNTNQTAVGGVFTAVTLSNVVAGDMLLVVARCTPSAGSATPTISDGVNTWIQITVLTNGASQNASWYCKSSVAGTVNITIAQASANFLEAVFVEYGQRYILEEKNTATGSASVLTTASVTSLQAPELVIGWCSNETANGRTFTYGTGFSATDSANGNVAVEDLLAATASVHASSITYSGTGVTWFAGVLAFFQYPLAATPLQQQIYA